LFIIGILNLQQIKLSWKNYEEKITDRHYACDYRASFQLKYPCVKDQEVINKKAV
jgi:hypothetical protein